MSNKRYIVYERPVGSLCWTMAHDSETGRVMEATNLKVARDKAREVRKRFAVNGKPMKAHIAVIDLPWTKTDQRIKDAWQKKRGKPIRQEETT